MSVTFYPAPVGDVIARSLPWTLGLATISLIITVAIGIALGTIAGRRRGGRVDAVVPTTTFLAAIPYVWPALILLYLLGGVVHWFPLNGGYDHAGVTMGFTGAFPASALYHGAPQGPAEVISGVAGWLLGRRDMMVSTMARHLDRDEVRAVQERHVSAGRKRPPRPLH